MFAQGRYRERKGGDFEKKGNRHLRGDRDINVEMRIKGGRKAGRRCSEEKVGGLREELSEDNLDLRYYINVFIII